MKQLLTFLCATLLLCSCNRITGSGNIVTEKRSTGQFNGVSASAGIEVELKNGPTSVVVEADDNVIKYLKTDVSGNTLKMYLRSGISLTDCHLKVFITAPSIKRLNASSGSEIEVRDILAGSDKITFNSSSSGRITAEIDAPFVGTEASSGGKIILKGRTMELTANVSSGGSLEAAGLLAERTDVNASSGSDAFVHASISIKANASSGGNIKYRGGAPENAQVSSGGSVTKED